MCVIIYKPAGVALPEEDIRNAYDNNPHGFGYMYYDESTGKVVHKKSVKWDADKIVSIFASQIDKTVCYHYRWATHGDKIDALCHPFKITDKDKDGVDMFFMHNGVISGHTKGLKANESDTTDFNNKILKPLLRKRPDLIEDDALHQLLLDYIGASKLMFMHHNGEVIMTNGDGFVEYKGCTVSNLYSFQPRYRDEKKTMLSTGTAGKRTTSHHNGKATTPEDKLILGAPVKLGDKVSVFEEGTFDLGPLTGTLTALSPTSGEVEYVKRNEVKSVRRFWSDDGISFGSYTEPRIYVIPVYPTVKGIDDTVDLSTLKRNDIKQVPACIPCEEVVVDKRNDEELFKISEDNRWTGEAFLEVDAVYNYDYNGTTVYDVFNMSSTERFNKFADNPVDMFNMFQDLVEGMVAMSDFLTEEDLETEEDEISFNKAVKKVG